MHNLPKNLTAYLRRNLCAVFLYNIVRSGKLPRRILIGKNCCEGVKKYLSERIDEINSYISDSSQTAFE